MTALASITSQADFTALQTTYSLFGLIIYVITVIALWKVFTKAGYAGWLAIIPIGAYEPRDFMKNSHIDPAEAMAVSTAAESRASTALRSRPSTSDVPRHCRRDGRPSCIHTVNQSHWSCRQQRV